jgi:hypothetical protein
MKIATRTFTAEYGGERIVIQEGERVAPDHQLAKAHPDCFGDRSLPEELEIRSTRIAELQRDQHEGTRRDLPLTEAGRRAEQDARFWDGVTRMLDDGVSSSERAEQAVFDRGLAHLEEIESRARQDGIDLLLEGWAGRLG